MSITGHFPYYALSLWHRVFCCFLALRVQFEDFFEEVYQELSKFGEISEMNVCDNLGDHLIGNVYVKASVGLCLCPRVYMCICVCCRWF